MMPTVDLGGVTYHQKGGEEEKMSGVPKYFFRVKKILANIQNKQTATFREMKSVQLDKFNRYLKTFTIRFNFWLTPNFS